MTDGATTHRRIPRTRPRWASALMAAAAVLFLAGIMEVAATLTRPDTTVAGRHVGHPNTRSPVLPLLPRP